MILVTDALRDSVCPRTLTFLEVMQLGIAGLQSVCTKFSDFDARLRKASIALSSVYLGWRSTTAQTALVEGIWVGFGWHV